MRPVIVGKFRTIKELEHMSFTYKKDLRERVRFLIVDDEPFVYLDKLRNAKFNVTHVGDILDLHAKKFKINDEEILNAIKFHVYGRVNMTLFEKILVIADFAEDSREYARCKEVRKILDEGNFDLAMYLCIKYTIEAVLAKGDMPLAEQYEILNELNQKILGEL